jgi:carbon-monoxide dehydrogenase iron sulfur subunit
MKRIMVYAERCTGCRLCESTCALYNDNVNDLSRSRIRIVKKNSVGLAAPVVCHQCKKPPCLKACPVDAIKKEPDGLVRIDAELCIGCEACVTECPFGIMISVLDKVTKCELCNGDPQCVKYCATAAIEYGEPETLVQERRVKHASLLLEEKEI